MAAVVLPAFVSALATVPPGTRFRRATGSTSQNAAPFTRAEIESAAEGFWCRRTDQSEAPEAGQAAGMVAWQAK